MELTTYTHCGATFVIDGDTAYVTRYGITHVMTAAESRVTWLALSAERASYRAPVNVATGARWLKGW
jgi:hypothetical protein